MEMNLKSTVVSSIESMLKSHTDEVVRKLSEKYLFSQEDALAFVGLSTVSLYNRDSSVKRMSPKPKRSAQLKSDVRDGPFPFPYQSTDASYCEALRYNYGLYTQCCVETEDKYCSECLAEGCSKGTIEGRDDPMFKGRPGKPMIVYSKVLKKLGHSVEYAKSQAETYGKEIDESVYELVSKKGRPKKEKTVVVGEVVPKKKSQSQKEELETCFCQSLITRAIRLDMIRDLKWEIIYHYRRHHRQKNPTIVINPKNNLKKRKINLWY